MNVEQQARALLDLVEADRARQCEQILDDERRRTAALLEQAHAQARARMRGVFDEQRQRWRERIAAAQARLATQRRLHEQQRTAALLQLAWARLPVELAARWQHAASRALWVDHVLATARARLPAGAWHLVHAPHWPAAEQQALAARVQKLAGASGKAPVFEADPAIESGLKVVSDGNAIDGTLSGLLADRAAVEARLLRRLEAAP